MKGFIGKGELNKDMYNMPGRVAALLREINNATLQGGRITITFWSGTGLDETLINWETEDES